MSYPTLPMEIQTREVDVEDRLISGVVAPYDETSYLVPDPSGERICRGAFNRSINAQAEAKPRHRVRLVVGHTQAPDAIGLAESWTDDRRGLTGVFKIRSGPKGDEVLELARGGYYGGLSVEFVAIDRRRSDVDGVMEVREAKLYQVALVGVPAYESASAIAVRSASDIVAGMFKPRPVVDTSPTPVFW